VAVIADAGANSIRAELGPPDEDGEQEFALPLPLANGVVASWKVRAVDARDRAYRISWPADAEQDLRVDGPGGVVWRRNPGGWAELGTGQRAVEVLEVQVGDADLSAEVLLRGLSAADADLAQLVGPLAAVPTHRVEPLGGGRLRLTLPLHVSRWGGPDLPLPSGVYQLEFGSLLATWADPAASQLPVDGLTGSHRFRLGATGAGLTFRLSLSGPRLDDEVGRWPQTQLGDWYAATDFAPTESVLFQSYRGEFATDSPLEVHAELVRRHTPLELLWGVTDLSVPVPEGGRALLIESRDWYAALGRSRYLCRNIDVERYFRRRPEQRYLQTFHGYPFKSMGASLWRTQGRADTVIEVERVRRSSAWDAIVVPEDFCVEFYRQEYGYTGPALVTGYPRNDPLTTADPAVMRSQVLSRLGLEPDHILVLYAPTWRDTVATSAWTAKMFDGLDLEELAAQLGDRYMVLVRGHNYNLREGLGPLPSAVRDVSSYPEVNDLIMAADVAVLDYSSLRFDWLITEKPVLFFVPDLTEYLETRTVLFAYPPTAPGPWLDSTRAVGDALLDLAGVTARYAAARKKFNERFNRRHDGYATKRVVDAFFA
jgi:CDP-glycerol glycerophosphotransferase